MLAVKNINISRYDPISTYLDRLIQREAKIWRRSCSSEKRQAKGNQAPRDFVDVYGRLWTMLNNVR